MPYIYILRDKPEIQSTYIFLSEALCVYLKETMDCHLGRERETAGVFLGFCIVAIMCSRPPTSLDRVVSYVSICVCVYTQAKANWKLHMEAFTLSLTLFFSSLMMAISLRSDPDLFFTRGIHPTIRKNLG